MQTAIQHDLVSVKDYLAAEQESEIRHEYLGGLVYAMAGETRAHNTIALNLTTSIRQHLKGGPCRTYMSDIRVNFMMREDEYYYYPDIVVTCDSRDSHERFIRFPKLIIEVLSNSTERVHRREKFFAYTTLDSLEEYVLVGQTSRELTCFRRSTNWRAETVSGESTELVLTSLDLKLPISSIYEGT